MRRYRLRNLVDLHILQKIIDDMYRMTGIVGSIIDEDKILVSTCGNKSVCMQYHRCHPESFAYCNTSDASLFQKIRELEKPVIRQCENGLIDAAYPIYIDRMYYGAVMSGQIFTCRPDLDFFWNMAQKYGYDAEAYIRAIENVPVIPEERFQAAVDFYGQLAEVIARLSIARLKEMEEKNSLEQEVRERTRELSAANAQLKKEILNGTRLTREISENEEKYRTLFESSSDAIMLFDLEKMHIYEMNHRAEKIFGYTREEIYKSKNMPDLIPEFSDMPKLLADIPVQTLPLVWFRKEDGNFIPLEITAGLLMIHGEKNGFAIMRDISESVNNNLKQTQLIQKIQSIFAEVKSFTDFVATDINMLGPRRYLGDYGITRQEDKVVYYILQGLRNKEIGEKLFLSKETVRKHVHSVLRKLNLKNRVELIHMLKNKNIKIFYDEKTPP